jgi:hypothetical protein
MDSNMESGKGREMRSEERRGKEKEGKMEWE